MAAFLPAPLARQRLSVCTWLMLLLGALIGAPVHAADDLSGVAQALTGSGAHTDSPDEARIDTTPSPSRDSDIQTRIAGIFSEIDGLDAVEISVIQGVVTLSGETANEKKAQQAINLANRLTDVVTVNDAINAGCAGQCLHRRAGAGGAGPRPDQGPAPAAGRYCAVRACRVVRGLALPTPAPVATPDPQPVRGGAGVANRPGHFYCLRADSSA